MLMVLSYINHIAIKLDLITISRTSMKVSISELIEVNEGKGDGPKTFVKVEYATEACQNHSWIDPT